MATQTTDQQNALKDAMARAKQIAAKLQQQVPNGDADKTEGRKRGFDDICDPPQPNIKKGLMDGTDPKALAQKFANSLIPKSHTGPMLVEEVTIPNKLVGLVIGRGGEMINKLQSESGAKVQVAPDPPPNMSGSGRQVTITGNAEAVGKAKSLIAEIESAGKVPERWSGVTNPGEFMVEMSISKAKVGLIIGKGGETIKTLQERAGCKMVLLQEGEFANTPEKPLRISGEQGAVMYGKQLVQDLLTSKELEGINTNRNNQQQGGPNYKEMDVPREAVGLIIGSKGANVHQIQSETGCRIRFKNEMQGPTKIAMLSGNPQQIAAAEAKLQEIIETGGPGHKQPSNGPSGAQQGWGATPGPQGPHGPHGPGWGQGNSNRPSNLPPGHKDMIVEVPANRCGLVIGKGGETIKLIKNESQVNIQLNRNIPETSPFRIFSVQGTDEMIEKALAIIREKIGDRSITARPADGSEPTPNPWGVPSPNPWGPQPTPDQQWSQPQQQWPGQQQQNMQPNGWGQQQQQPQQQPHQSIWSQPPLQQSSQGWNPSQPAQPNWDTQQQWQQQNGPDQNPWSNQPQWGPPGQQPQGAANCYQPSGNTPGQGQVNPNPVAPANVAQGEGQPPVGQPAAGQPAAGQPAGGQPDYSAAWALYYQQQQQYYQQYAAQQQSGAVSTAPGVSSAASSAPTVAHAQVTADSSQAQAMAEYQAKLAEYYKQFGQQVPQ